MLELTNRSRTTLTCFVFLALTLLVVNFIMVAPYLLAVLMGGILSLISRPVYGWLQRRGLGPSLAALAVTLGVLIVIVGPLALFTAAVVDQAVDVGKQISQNPAITVDSAKEWIAHWKPVKTLVGDAVEIEKQMRTGAQKLGALASGALLGVFGTLPELVLQLALALMSCYFLLVDGPRFYAWLRDRLPLDPDVREKLFLSFQNTAVSSLLSTFVSAGVQAVLIFIGFLILGIPCAFLAAGATFIFAWVPLLGSTPVAIAGAVYLYSQGDIPRLIALIAIAAVVGISDNVVRPLVLRGQDEMHPLVALVAIFGGIAMFGLFGVFIGPILASLLLSVLQIWPSVGRRFGLLAPAFSTAPDAEPVTGVEGQSQGHSGIILPLGTQT
jgi:predicted PurR-regulated permease PerM